MNNIGLYIFDKSADNNKVRGIFTKYQMHSIDKMYGENPDLGKDKMAYLEGKPEATFGQFMGVADQYGLTTLDKARAIDIIAEREAEKLQAIAQVMSKENYERKVDKFNNKRVAIQRKLNTAKDDAMGHAGFGTMSTVTASAMLDKFSDSKEQIQGDSKISKQQAKLEKYLEKNKVLNESQTYSKQQFAMGMGQTLVDFGVSSQKSVKDSISGAIESSKTQSSVEKAFIKFTEVIKELLTITKEVGVMIADDDKHVEVKNVKKVKLDALKPEDLLFAKAGEVYYISQ